MKLRHIVSINDLSQEEIEAVFSAADHYLGAFGDPDFPFRIGASTDECAGSVMATLFYEPSTRTRLSFETAMLRLGGKAISSADPAASSAAKGETLTDAIRIVSAYADIIVLRHPCDGAAYLAAQYASVPVINGGDGAHEHPTQTLCDLYTLRRERGRLEDLNVALFGDLRSSRTVHSLAYALARFGANIMLMPATGMDLPDHVDWRLRHEFNCVRLGSADMPELGDLVTGAYVRQNRARPQSTEKLDAIYVTRFQRERWTEAARDYPIVDAEFLRAPAFRDALVLHPLPRVNELDPALDSDDRAAYFRQASYGVPVRMALISLLLNPKHDLSPGTFNREGIGGDQPMRFADRSCPNEKCITRFEPNAPHVFGQVAGMRHLRCLYCEHDLSGR